MPFTLKIGRLGLLLLLIPYSQLAAKEYVVKQGDTLSQIAFIHISKEVYGPAGSLKKLLALNPGILNENQIHPGEIIRVSPERQRTTAKLSLVPPAPETRHLAENSKPETSVSAPSVALSAPEVTDNRNRFSYLTVKPFLSYSRWDGRDPRDGSKASLLSKTNVGIDADWVQVWSDHWKSFETIGVTRYEILPDISSNIAIQNSVQVAPRFGAGAAYSISPSLELGGRFLYAQEIYYHGQNGFQGIVLDGVMTPEGQLWIAQRILNLAPFDLGVEGRFISLLPSSTANYTTSFGFGYQGKVELGQNFDTGRVSVGLTYLYQTQNSSILSLTKRELGFAVGLTWRLGQ